MPECRTGTQQVLRPECPTLDWSIFACTNGGSAAAEPLANMMAGSLQAPFTVLCLVASQFLPIFGDIQGPGRHCWHVSAQFASHKHRT